VIEACRVLQCSVVKGWKGLQWNVMEDWIGLQCSVVKGWRGILWNETEAWRGLQCSEVQYM
jgi:hypothetical protein